MYHTENNSALPKSNMYHTENRLNDITLDKEKLLKIIQSLDANKTHGYMLNKNVKTKQSIHNKTTFYYVSELPEI